MAKPIKILTFDVFGTLLDYSNAPWINYYVTELKAIREGVRPYRILGDIFKDIDANLNDLTVKPTVLDCLGRLKNFFHITPLSNADEFLSVRIAQHFELPWNISFIPTEVSACFKPDPLFYENTARFLAEQYGTLDEEVCHVAAHPYDLVGAKRAGFRTAFVDWDNDPLLPSHNVSFDFSAPDLLTLTDALVESLVFWRTSSAD